ncbi:OsmC family protein [Variovorax sp. KK3]|uniref:OsmC family protein n=1 Tax=Variovorax sp. KK3 TaxID=1855728 RepID=UPI00097CBB0F|nr:OsmC family protein [Variovorax sp. KK3]
MTITVRRDGTTGTRHIVKIRGHEFAVDTSLDGHDAGPSPHDLYDAALAACKALTVLVYAQHKGIPVEEIEVTVDRDDSQERQGVYKLDATLHVSGAIGDDQKAALLRVAGKCPLHKLMTEVKTEIDTRLV